SALSCLIQLVFQFSGKLDLRDMLFITHIVIVADIVIAVGTLIYELIRDGAVICLAKEDGSGYILMEDLDDDPDTITFKTDDFDSVYMLVSLEDENKGCRWHYVILIVTIIYSLGLFIIMKRKREEEDDEAEISGKEDPEGNQKKRKRNSVICRGISQTALLAVYIWVNICGCCYLELLCAVVGMLVVSLAQFLTYRDKFKLDKNEKQKR
ncbi:MAG: hypothetical protein ACI4AA_08165, partial [Lachnospiraceae bacterium]